MDCSGTVEVVETLGGGTGMYDVILENRPCLMIECSGRGPSGVCMLTAKPLKQGMLADVPCSYSLEFRGRRRLLFCRDVKCGQSKP